MVIDYYSRCLLQIFNEKPTFNTGPRIDARREDYVKPGGNVAVSYQYFQIIKNLADIFRLLIFENNKLF